IKLKNGRGGSPDGRAPHKKIASWPMPVNRHETTVESRRTRANNVARRRAWLWRAARSSGDLSEAGSATIRPSRRPPGGAVVQRVLHLAHPERRHLRVDLVRHADHARLVVERAHLPGEIVRIERDAVSAEAGAWRELHVAERLGGRRIDHFPDIDAEPVAD